MYALREALNGVPPRAGPYRTVRRDDRAVALRRRPVRAGRSQRPAGHPGRGVPRRDRRLPARRRESVVGPVDATQQIREFPEVRAVRYVSREEALEIARRELHELSSLFGTLEANPLPASLEVSLHTGQADAARRTRGGRARGAIPLRRGGQLRRRLARQGVRPPAVAAAATADAGYRLRRGGRAHHRRRHPHGHLRAPRRDHHHAAGRRHRRFHPDALRTRGPAHRLHRRDAGRRGDVGRLPSAVRRSRSARLAARHLPAGRVAGGAAVGVLSSTVAVRRHLREIT
jgi:hypothetical protein